MWDDLLFSDNLRWWNLMPEPSARLLFALLMELGTKISALFLSYQRIVCHQLRSNIQFVFSTFILMFNPETWCAVRKFWLFFSLRMINTWPISRRPTKINANQIHLVWIWFTRVETRANDLVKGLRNAPKKKLLVRRQGPIGSNFCFY